MKRDNAKLLQELDWWRTYGNFISKYHRNINDRACEFSDEVTKHFYYE